MSRSDANFAEKMASDASGWNKSLNCFFDALSPTLVWNWEKAKIIIYVTLTHTLTHTHTLTLTHTHVSPSPSANTHTHPHTLWHTSTFLCSLVIFESSRWCFSKPQMLSAAETWWRHQPLEKEDTWNGWFHFDLFLSHSLSLSPFSLSVFLSSYVRELCSFTHTVMAHETFWYL